MWCRDTLLGVTTWLGRNGVATHFLVSRPGCAVMVSRPIVGVATRQLQGRATLGYDTLSSVATWVRKFGVLTHNLVSRHGLATWCRDRSGGRPQRQGSRLARSARLHG